MLPKNRAPTPPGEILLEEFLKPGGMTQMELASRMNVPVQRVNTLINGRRAVTPETAILLSRVFATTPEFWMNLQVRHDLWIAHQRMGPAKAPVKAADASRAASPPARRGRGNGVASR
jgi:addiction module HigA family antidote